MKLSTLTREQCQQVREWRNNEPQFLRTPYLLTEKMQDDFFDNVVNNRESKHRYFALMSEPVEYVEMTSIKQPEKFTSEPSFIGMGGLTNIEWENGTAEISLIINPEYRRKGKGREAVKLLLDEAWQNIRLVSVYGEVYKCGNVLFWENVLNEYNHTYRTELPDRKYYKGVSWPSVWFAFMRYQSVTFYKEDKK
jgi:RimJ/RimL family protein N-acetyltransferase